MVKLNKIYTRTGDDGSTGLVGGARLPKYALRVEAYGTIDEAGAAIGLARLVTDRHAYWDDMLKRIQHDLFDAGADLATPLVEGEAEGAALRIVCAQVTRLEEEIDALNEQLKPLDSFVLAGGTPLAAQLHLARCVVRRAERITCHLSQEEPINPEALRYLNRLSDHLFVLARVANDNGALDVLWQKGVNR